MMSTCTALPGHQQQHAASQRAGFEAVGGVRQVYRITYSITKVKSETATVVSYVTLRSLSARHADVVRGEEGGQEDSLHTTRLFMLWVLSFPAERGLSHDKPCPPHPTGALRLGTVVLAYVRRVVHIFARTSHLAVRRRNRASANDEVGSDRMGAAQTTRLNHQPADVFFC